MKNLMIEYTQGADVVTLDEAAAVYQKLGIAMAVHDGRRTVFCYEGK